MIQIQNLHKKYGSKPVLSGINFEFEPGKVYGIVGENGAGKTTLFRCIAGLESYDGTIQSPSFSIKEHLGFLVTDPYFFPKMTGLEYLSLMRHSRGLDYTDLVSKNIFDLPLNEYAANYSTGMKKKLALLGILIQENKFFILDEPFNGVDIQSNILITEILHQLRDLNKTLILSSHIFSTLRENCDVILVLDNQQITQVVNKEQFNLLEIEMRSQTMAKGIGALNLK